MGVARRFSLSDIGRGGFAAAGVHSTTLVHAVTVVYNLKVDGCPEYFAAGALVHNCDAASAAFHALAASVSVYESRGLTVVSGPPDVRRRDPLDDDED